MPRSAKRPDSGRWSGADSRAVAAALLLPFAIPLAPPALAQAVIQPVPDPAAGALAEALRTLARNPQSLEALIAAGDASLRLDDLEAALGFFTRAEAAAPTDGRAKAGRASVLARREQPVEALRLFAEAERLGAPMVIYAADRGLAYDLVGDNANAQGAYREALSQAPDDAVTRRLAISQAIGGDRAASEATLLPLLQRQDLAAFRARAFALAILGQEDEAVSIAETMLPARLSSRLAPYLRYMTRLTRAQQAAAANLGRFPRAAEIGRDDPAIAELAGSASPSAAPQPAARGADARLVPSGAPMGSRRRGQEATAPAPTRAPAPTQSSPAPAPAPTQPPPAAAPQQAQVSPSAELPPVDAAPAQPSVAGPVVQPLPPAVEEPAVQPQPASSPPALAASTPATAPAAAPAPRPAEPAAPPVQTVQPDLASAFADLAQAPRPRPAAGAAGAVDITTIEPRRETPRPPPPPPPPPNPRREWVQLATGRNADALAFDWRRIKRAADGALDKDRPHLAAWGDRTRLLIGPFANAAEAQAAVRALAGADIDSFRFTSAEGEEVRPLD